MTHPVITIAIVPGLNGQPPMVRASAGSLDNTPDQAIMADTDTALVARAMLSSAAYLFAQGQAVQFGPEVPLEALK